MLDMVPVLLFGIFFLMMTLQFVFWMSSIHSAELGAYRGAWILEGDSSQQERARTECQQECNCRLENLLEKPRLSRKAAEFFS